MIRCAARKIITNMAEAVKGGGNQCKISSKNVRPRAFSYDLWYNEML